MPDLQGITTPGGIYIRELLPVAPAHVPWDQPGADPLGDIRRFLERRGLWLRQTL